MEGSAKGHRAVLVTLGLALCVAAAFLLVSGPKLPALRGRGGEFVWPDPPASAAGSPRIDQRVYISSGAIPLADFVKFLSDFTGITVIADSRLAGRPITVLSDIDDADREMVRLLLLENGFALRREVLPDRREVLVVEER
jgi:hypothetical protein